MTGLHGVLGPLAAPLAGLFGCGALVRRWVYDRRLRRPWTPPVPTISVGGLEAGGTGKTQVAELLLRLLADAGRRPGLLTRGYRRRSRGLVLRAPGQPGDWEMIGDEPAMILRAGLDVPVAVCADRRAGARALVDELSCDALVLDDGFSHRRLGRHVDLVVLRGEAPLGDGHFLPWGSLREPASSLRRADVVWLHYRDVAEAGSDPIVPADWPRYGSPATTRVVSRAQPTRARTLEGEVFDLAGARVFAVAGIARPAELANSLRRLGAEVIEEIPFPDHHRYREAELDKLWAHARERGADGVVVTPKDAVKLERFASGAGLWVVGTRMVIERGGSALRERLIF